MQGKYILSAFCIIFLLITPAAASLAKIAAGSPVYLGENDIDISAALNGCHTIAWWQNGTSMDAQPAKNVTVYEINSVSDNIYHFNISTERFTGFTGTWYCEDKKPNFPVFDLRDPQVAISVWDLDNDQDVTGKSIPRATNITYRIDTNLYPAHNYLNRLNLNPTDRFFTVKLTDPRGRNVANIFSGSYGGATTLILPFDSNPQVTSSPYFWKNGNAWDHAARNIQGDMIYPPGTYTFTITQNLNNIQSSYPSSGGIGSEGTTTSSAVVTFLASDPLTVPSLLETTVSISPEVPISAPATPVAVTASVIPTSSPVAKKTTFAPLPGWIALFGIGIAGTLAIVRKNT